VRTARLLVDVLRVNLLQVVNSLEGEGRTQYQLLQALVTEREARDTIMFDTELYDIYVELMCKYDSSLVEMYLKTGHGYADETVYQVLVTCPVMCPVMCHVPCHVSCTLPCVMCHVPCHVSCALSCALSCVMCPVMCHVPCHVSCALSCALSCVMCPVMCHVPCHVSCALSCVMAYACLQYTVY